ncbi:hypothetical protein D6D21_03171 [Aureobasidium pullulans]|uniref:TLDc domain-containing protein n=1 Tax=Aureobasidium pullulans TaxID=5580 RepID=A0AB74J3Y5_AURPU|nr:hypothetical protein D6D21_03171 [Aureobasidium pullulans]
MTSNESAYQPTKSLWRVTPENPVRYHDRLDYERCAALHNELLELGWTGSGRSLDDLETDTWFEIWGQEAEDCRVLLSNDLIAFLERAQIPKTDDEYSLFFYVYGFAPPKRLWDTFHWRFDEPEKYRYLTLLLANLGPSHPDGLAFDQKTNRAIMQMSIHDASITLNGRTPWFPLEVILSAWLDMVDIGKIQAVEETVEVNEKFDPWICRHWNQGMVQETVEAFSALVNSIEARMKDQGMRVTDADQPLLLDESLEAAHTPHGFARSFLSQARRPSFTYIAPGVSIPNQDSFAQQPFFSVEYEEQDEDVDEDELVIKPILLFASSSSVRLASEDEKNHPFSWPYNQLLSFPAGLYLTESERSAGHEFEDSARFVLPFGVGGHGFARTSDGLQIGDHQDGQDACCADRIADLYQPGWNPFIEMHEVRLVKILDSWKGMVERGDWTVGAEGIQDNIDAFKEADTEENWRKFIVPITW